jgi:hypothetical protein
MLTGKMVVGVRSSLTELSLKETAIRKGFGFLEKM